MEDDFGLGVRTPLDFNVAVMRTRLSLRAHGFSILSEMPAPVGVGDEAGRRHLFMGVWERLIIAGNLGGPGLDVGDHLPCNVVVFEQDHATMIAALDPAEGMDGWGPAAEVAEQAQGALREALRAIAQPLGAEAI
ncbi:MAG: hypothetical protein ACT4OM_01195 [Actinomycetota bacterium]